MGEVTFARLCPEDLSEIRLQPRQARQMAQLPFAGDSAEDAAAIAAQPIAWCARRQGRIVACFGIYETFPGKHGVAWAMLAEGIGPAHLALTRFIQGEIVRCGLARLELLTAAPDIEEPIAVAERAFGGFNPGSKVRRAFQHATPEMRWAVLLGLEPVHLLRQFGAQGVSLMLFERIRAPIAALQEAA